MIETTKYHLAVFDNWAGQLVAKAREQGDTVPCRKGCGACCYDITEVGHFEIAPLIETLRALPADELDRIERRLEAWRDGMLAAGLDPRLPAPPLRAYHRAHLACPLLDLVTHECTVYDVRPLSCRGHFIVNAPPEVCSNRAEVPRVQVIDVDEIVAAVVQSLAKDYGEAIGRKEITVGFNTLPGMLIEAWPLVRDPSLSVVEWMQRVER